MDAVQDGTAGVLDQEQADGLRARLVDGLLAGGWIRTAEVEAAFRAVPRHLFTPEASLEAAYADTVVRTKFDADGAAISSVSAPWLQATMIEQARLTAGMRCLELGSGGYNAALLAEVVGPAGEVTTIDIDPEITDRAARFLATAGYGQVQVLTRDGWHGAAEHAPFDAIIVTAQAVDIPPAWVDQLVDDGRLVIPLRLRGLSRGIAFERHGSRLVSRETQMCGFVRMQGAGASPMRRLALRGGEIALRFDGNYPAQPELFDGILDSPRVDVWTGVRIPPITSFDTLKLWLATVFDDYCELDVAKDAAIESLAPAGRPPGDAIVNDASIAYLTCPKIAESLHEFRVHAFGPDATTLAEDLADQIRIWERDHRNGPGPRITAHPLGTPDHDLPPGHTLDRAHTRITITWPQPADPGAPHHGSGSGQARSRWAWERRQGHAGQTVDSVTYCSTRTRSGPFTRGTQRVSRERP
ncbi:methyltransferase, FxLD system [Frankia sp. Cpl3]|uniref:methyltransferase, FxLD system n=1 Tax=Parafrankia colletiae TaxID=573497 RepID=UPI000B2431BC|nr:methyltransferase, FxLD system [Parafrankia colletiae]MCK9904983.1 methyltransferase, FxLD system [Frankia sp. Cpl3]